MNEFKTILVHLDASTRSAVRLRLAAALAEPHAGVVEAAFAAVPTALAGAVAMSEGSALLLAAADELDQQQRRRARLVLDEVHAGPRVRWRELEGGMPLPAFVRAAFTSDLLVLGQHDAADAGSGAVPRGFAESVIVDSGKPAIVVPHTGAFERTGRTVMVAWKRTREAARALAAALPLLGGAQQVHVAAWGDDPRDVEHMLLRHGIHPAYHAEPAARGDDIGERLLSRAADLGADLLVLGLYGHSRAREWVLGGASRTVLDSMTLPVLMAH